MLVDGGLTKHPPCCRLPHNQKVNVVVVTHFDSDYIRGILRLFEEDELPIDIGELYTVKPSPPLQQNKSTLSKIEVQLRTLNC